jgi:hypothetical protein
MIIILIIIILVIIIVAATRWPPLIKTVSTNVSNDVSTNDVSTNVNDVSTNDVSTNVSADDISNDDISNDTNISNDSTEFSCNICYERTNNIIILCNCFRRICLPCSKTHREMWWKEQRCRPFSCPVCGKAVKETKLLSFLAMCTEEENRKWGIQRTEDVAINNPMTMTLRDKLTSLKIRLTTTKCPLCEARVKRTEGCNHMTCICGYNFCYKCRNEWGHHNSYFRCPRIGLRIKNIFT